MLRIADQWHGSDLGLQRQGNEDNYFVRAPLFVVADGMGGAQSGEVASEMAVEAFGAGHPGRRLAGRGPACTSSRRPTGASTSARGRRPSAPAWARRSPPRYVGENSVTIAHVGDSRCYLVRDGELERLTDGPLARRRARRPRQADRGAGRDAPAALGDHARARARAERAGRRHRGARRTAGDLFLVCSDGLTSMVREAEAQAAAGRAQRARWTSSAATLIAAANAAGGRDNITVILFTLEEVDAPVAPAPAPTAASEARRRGHERVRHLHRARRSPSRARASAARRATRAAATRRRPRRGPRQRRGRGRVPRLRAPSRSPRCARARSRSRRATRTRRRAERAPRKRRRRSSRRAS